VDALGSVHVLLPKTPEPHLLDQLLQVNIKYY
jgi:hypothetical protein